MEQLIKDKIALGIAQTFALYGTNCKCAFDTESGAYHFNSDLGGGREIRAYYVENNILVIGFQNGEARLTRNPRRYWKRMLKEFNREIEIWILDHKEIWERNKQNG